jgi:CheY-like chemotaxis protein
VVQTVGSGEEALEVLTQRTFDLVILDIMMPGMGGFETLLQIRKKFSPAELPVIFLTAKNRVSDLRAGFEAGANDYITKPCAQEELLSRVASQLKILEAAHLLEEVGRLKRIVKHQREVENNEQLSLQEMDLKKLANTSMELAVRCYEEETGKDALEFARDSELWKIEMNPDGWERARTLNRYLSLRSCPKNPRMKTVLASVAFALNQAGASNSCKKTLTVLFRQLELNS